MLALRDTGEGQSDYTGRSSPFGVVGITKFGARLLLQGTVGRVSVRLIASKPVTS